MQFRAFIAIKIGCRMTSSHLKSKEGRGGELGSSESPVRACNPKDNPILRKQPQLSLSFSCRPRFSFCTSGCKGGAPSRSMPPRGLYGGGVSDPCGVGQRMLTFYTTTMSSSDVHWALRTVDGSVLVESPTYSMEILGRAKVQRRTMLRMRHESFECYEEEYDLACVRLKHALRPPPPPGLPGVTRATALTTKPIVRLRFQL